MSPPDPSSLRISCASPYLQFLLQLLKPLALFAFPSPALTYVPCVRKRADDRGIAVMNDSEGELHVDRGAVLAKGACWQSLSAVFCLAFCQCSLVATPVRFAEAFRNDEIQALPDRLVAWMTRTPARRRGSIPG